MPRLSAAVATAIVMLLALIAHPGTSSFAQAVASATTTLTAVPTATATPIAGQNTQAVAYQINPAHTGAAQLPSLVAPLVQKWAFSPGGALSYPIVAQGRVFVSVADPNFGTRLYALDENTGQVSWGPTELGGTYWWSASAFDAGQLFVVNYSGLLRAFDAQGGTLLWSTQLPGQSSFTSPPTALQGTVFVGGAGSGGTLYAVSEMNGAVLWTAAVLNGDASSPALSDDGVFVSYTCPNVYKFDRSLATALWHFGPSGCSGGGGRTPVYYQGRLYVRDATSKPSGSVLDSQTGALVGSYSAGPAPAVAGSQRYALTGQTLSAVDLQTGATVWTFGGDGTLSSAPIVVNQQVYVGATSGNLYALDANTGRIVWTTAVGSGIPAPDEQNVSQPLTGLNAGDGLLVVPAGNLLVAYAAPPPSTPTPVPTFTSTPTATATPSITPTSTPPVAPTSTPTATRTPHASKGHH